MKTPVHLLFALGSVVLLGTACVNLKPAPNVTRFFVLGPLPGATNQTPAKVSLGLRRVQLPAYLNKPWLALRQGDQIHYSRTNEWAEPLGQGVQRVLAADLSLLLGTDTVKLNQWDLGTVQFELSLRLIQFEVNGNGDGSLVVQWEILGPKNLTPLQSGQSSLSRQDTEAASNPDRQVQLLSELLAEFSRELAQVIRKL